MRVFYACGIMGGVFPSFYLSVFPDFYSEYGLLLEIKKKKEKKNSLQ